MGSENHRDQAAIASRALRPPRAELRRRPRSPHVGPRFRGRTHPPSEARKYVAAARNRAGLAPQSHGTERDPGRNHPSLSSARTTATRRRRESAPKPGHSSCWCCRSRRRSPQRSAGCRSLCARACHRSREGERLPQLLCSHRRLSTGTEFDGSRAFIGELVVMSDQNDDFPMRASSASISGTGRIRLRISTGRSPNRYAIRGRPSQPLD